MSTQQPKQTGNRTISLRDNIISFSTNPVLKPLLGRSQLTINSQVLSFEKTQVDMQRFRILKISQRNADTVVTVTSNAPDLFQVAVQVQPGFKPSASFVPSPTGTYLHVSYTPTTTGQHTALLTIDTPYDTQAVTLVGRGFRPITQGWWMGLTAVMAFALLFTVFQYRCQILPQFCDSTADYQPSRPAITPQNRWSQSVPPTVDQPVIRQLDDAAADSPPKIMDEQYSETPESEQLSPNSQSRQSKPALNNVSTPDRRPVNRPNENGKSRRRRALPPVDEEVDEEIDEEVDEESDLERELNGTFN